MSERDGLKTDNSVLDRKLITLSKQNDLKVQKLSTEQKNTLMDKSLLDMKVKLLSEAKEQQVKQLVEERDL